MSAKSELETPPECNGVCVMACELISCVDFDVVAYPDPDCPLHGEATR